MRIEPRKDAILAGDEYGKKPVKPPLTLAHLLKSLFSASESTTGFALLAFTSVVLVFLSQAGILTFGSDDLNTQKEPSMEVETGVDPSKTQQHPADDESGYIALSLRSGETLIEALERQDINRGNAHQAINELATVADMKRIRPGQNIRLKVLPVANSDGEYIVEELRLRTSFDKEATVLRIGEGYQSDLVDVKTLTVTNLIEGTIEDSLYMSAQSAGLPVPVIIKAIRLLSFDVDFEREIREGDSYSVYFTRRFAPDFGDIEEGEILYLTLGMQKRTLEGTLYTDSSGKSEYFDNLGNSTRRALMKTPVDKAVMTSSYGKRRHPVLGYTRMHKGVDFRAYTGTPIMAAGDGIIERASRYGSYGNYVRIRHNGSYKTAYAHLSKYGRGVKKGARVTQGQVIGYSGATGRVTAAHLHYEVYYNGKQVNPMSLKLPSGRKLKDGELEDYATKRDALLGAVNQTRQNQQLITAQSRVNKDQTPSEGGGH